MFGFLKTSFQKVKNALSKTTSFLGLRLRNLFKDPWNEESIHQLEQILYEADLGTACSTTFAAKIEKLVKQDPSISTEKILETIRTYSLEILNTPPKITSNAKKVDDPLVILIVGVNGSGKTTTIAKLSRYFKEEGKKVLVAAGDTFRAAAIDQLTLWAEKINIDIVKSKPGSDPSSVAFDALTAAKARGSDVVLIDTAGRLQNKTDLMHELAKIRKVSTKVIPDAPHETFLVLDATTGQNAIDQTETFNKFTPLTGLILTKLDGSAKGGIILSI
ncbi:MAG: signal recognition particle-docking protein FtsY, partial [Chlamydiota bacterium]